MARRSRWADLATAPEHDEKNLLRRVIHSSQSWRCGYFPRNKTPEKCMQFYSVAHVVPALVLHLDARERHHLQALTNDHNFVRRCAWGLSNG
jgi:hypothetical protein